ncbi:hypothetical protein [Salinimonas sediminis]|uniref:hypothetical protein n=1 Tax=Salinimonas sediminis TaxID=2303538 RepID=UPI0014732659|nr:hypothetical protein [Salinimonas sediminis]
MVKDTETLSVQLESGLSLQCSLDPCGRVKLMQAGEKANVVATLILNNEEWVIEEE